MNLIYLPASGFQCWSAVHFFVHFEKWGTRGEMMRLPSAECQQICMRKEYRCDGEHFPLVPTIRSRSESWLLVLLYSSFTCLSIYSANLHGISLDWEDIISDEWVFTLQICVTISVESNTTAFIMKRTVNLTYSQLFFSPLYLLNLAKSNHDVHKYEESWGGSHLTFPSVCR